MLAFWDVCKHIHEHKKQKTKEEKSLWGRKYGLLARQIIRKQGEHIVKKSESAVICLFYITNLTFLRIWGSEFGIRNWYTGSKIALDMALVLLA